MVQGLNSGGPGIKSRVGEGFSEPVQNGPGAHPTFCILDTESPRGVKRVGCRVDHPTHLAPRLKKEESYTCTSPLRLHDLFQGEFDL
jgi:hypothetical protein